MFINCNSLISFSYISPRKTILKYDYKYKKNKNKNYSLSDNKINKFHKNNIPSSLSILISDILDKNNFNYIKNIFDSSFKKSELNIININSMFRECSSLIKIKGIEKWDTSLVSSFFCLFYKCNSLISLPDISKWNTINVTKMGFMFAECLSLISLPDISQWNIINVTDMNYMFYGCSSLISLPDISKWNTSNLPYLYNMFTSCSSLISLHNLYRWNINDIEQMTYMFDGCLSLISLFDPSGFNKINLIKNLFNEIKSRITDINYLLFEKYKNKAIIIYKNKKYLFKNGFNIEGKNREKFKIIFPLFNKLLSFDFIIENYNINLLPKETKYSNFNYQTYNLIPFKRNNVSISFYQAHRFQITFNQYYDYFNLINIKPIN